MSSLSQGPGGPHPVPFYLPPIPDPYTGQPRPPAAPVARRRVRPGRASRPDARLATPPPGEGPVLEWYRPSIWHAVTVGVVVFVGLFAMISAEEFGFDWVATWWYWLFFPPAGVAGVLSLRHRYSAGAYWLRCRGKVVRVYELTFVQLSNYYRSQYLELVDRRGARVLVPVGYVQAHRPLWDLVYAGIVHSAYRGARIDRQAAEVLQLPPSPTPGVRYS